ncbi:MAG: heme ABC transporter permease [Hyphomicrobiales bacterium]|nr:heme ABC transporter permease [Hyphomicrobiales bacterium]
MRSINTLANPSTFMRISGAVIPPLAVIAAALFAVGLYFVVNSPPDYQQGETVRIMYVHVPSAWLAMMCYTLIAVSAIGSLVWRHPLADVSMKAAAPIGAAFTFLALVTGSLWGKPTWGTYWQWDGRMTSVLILFFLYLGLIALWEAIEDYSRAGRAVAILALVGFINIPIIKFSVDWWSTLHQPASVSRFDAPAIHSSILTPLLVMAAAFTLLFFLLHLKAMRVEILKRRAARMMAQAAQPGFVFQPAE